MILILGDRDRVWLRVAAEAIRTTARRDGLIAPGWVGALELAATAGRSGTKPAPGDEVGESAAMPLLYRPDEAAELLRVSTRTLNRLIESGELRAVRVLNDRRIAREDLADFVEHRRHEDQSA